MTEDRVTPAGLRIVRLLVGNPPQTVAGLMAALGVTRTAISEQLNDLVAAGFVQRGTERLRGRGRPRHVYSATRAALVLLFATNQQVLVPAIWRAIRAEAGEEINRRIVRRVSQEMAATYKKQITATRPRERFRRLARLLCEEGAVVETEEKNGKLVMYKRSCPFISMLDEHYTVCCVDQEMMKAVVGRPIRRIACRHDGAPCCAFEIAEKDYENGLKVFIPIAIEKPTPYAKAVEPSFLRKAQAKHPS